MSHHGIRVHRAIKCGSRGRFSVSQLSNETQTECAVQDLPGEFSHLQIHKARYNEHTHGFTPLSIDLVGGLMPLSAHPSAVGGWCPWL